MNNLKLNQSFVWPLYLLIAGIIAWPIVANLGQGVPGSEGDVWVHLWTFRWVRDSLMAGRGFLYTDLMYYPNGVSMATHNFAWFHILLWIPLQFIVGEAAAYSLIFITGFSFTAWTTYLFVRELTEHRPSAFLAGLIVGFWPYTLSHHNHPNLIFIGFIPLALLAINRLFKDPGRKSSFWAGLAVAMIAIVRWQVLVYATPILLFYTLLLIIQTLTNSDQKEDEEARNRFKKMGTIVYQAVPALVIAAVGIFLSMSPIILNLDSSDFSSQSVSANETVTGSTDMAAYIVPPHYHPFWGDFFKPFTEPFIVNAVFTPFIGIGAFILVILGLAFNFRRSWPWLILALFYMSMALGPRLVVNATIFTETMPYDLIEGTIIDAIIRRPDRLNIFLSIPIAVMAAYGFWGSVNWASRKSTIKHFPAIALAGFTCLILIEYVTDYPIFDLRVPRWHEQMAEDPDDYAILEIPMHARVYDELYMQYQATHGKPMVGGHVSRLPDNALSFIQSISFLDAINTTGPNKQSFSLTQDLKNLSEANVRYIVLHKNLLRDVDLAQWQSFLLMLPVYEDHETLVFSTELPLDETLRPLYSFEPDQAMGLLDFDVTVPAPTQEGLIEAGLVWLPTDNVDQNDLEACLTLYNEDQSFSQESCQPLTYADADWPAFALNHTNHNLTISPYLHPDNYLVGMRLKPSNAFIELSPVDINVVPRSFDMPPLIQHETDLVWNEEIKLLGYDLNGEVVSLYWQAMSRTKNSYVRFIHIVDTDSGELVAQVDSAPRNWGYPTNWWETDEVIVEDLALPVTDLEEGTYHLLIGYYNRETGERASIRSIEDQFVIENDAAFLIDYISN